MKIRLLKLVDRIAGSLLTRVLSAPSVASSPVYGSFLVIRPGGIGDAILLIPAIEAIKRRFPAADISILAEKRNGAAFLLCPSIDRAFHYDNPKELLKAIQARYDVVIDTEQWHRLSALVARLTRSPLLIGFATNERKNLLTHPVSYSHDEYETASFFNLLAPLGISATDASCPPHLVVPEAALKSAAILLGGLERNPFVSVFPGASIPERRWGAERFRDVAKQLHARGIFSVVIGGRGEASIGDMIVSGTCGLNLAGKTSLIETAAVIQKSTVLVSGDSGILHIGVGLGTPTVSLFGPGIAKKWAPQGEEHVVINRRLPCSPCTKFGYTPKCPINVKCMSDIKVDEVVAAVEKLLFEELRSEE